MSIRTENLVTVLAGVALTGSALAASVETTKRAPIQGILPNAYSDIELSHHYKDEPTKTEQDVRMDAVYTLGSTFFDGALDSKIKLGVKKHANESRFYQKSTDIENYLSVYKNDYVAVKPYVLASLPYTDSDGEKHTTEGRFGIAVPAEYAISTGAGVVTLGAYYDAGAKFNNRYKVTLTEDGKAVARDARPEEALGLTADARRELSLETNKDGEYEVTPRALAMRQEAALVVGYKPSMVNALALEWKTRHIVKSDAVMEYDAATQTVVAPGENVFGQDYKHAGETLHRLRATYALTDRVYLQNDFGFANRLVDDKLNFANVFAVGATLF